MSTAKNATTMPKATSNGLTITEEILIDRLELTPSKAYDISLVDSVEQGRVISIRQQYKKKAAPSWENKKAIWIPFANAEEISRFMQQACKEGKRRHWDIPPTQQNAKPTQAATQPRTTPPVDIAQELLEVKKTIERLESYIHDTEAEKEQKENLKRIERILKALS